MSLASEIINIRKSNFATQEDFANDLGVSFSTVNRWEKDKTKPSNSAMKSLVAYCEKNKISSKNLQKEWLNIEK